MTFKDKDNRNSNRYRNCTMKLDVRYAMVIAALIYLLGFSTGSFFCSVATMYAMANPRSMLQQQRQQQVDHTYVSANQNTTTTSSHIRVGGTTTSNFKNITPAQDESSNLQHSKQHLLEPMLQQQQQQQQLKPNELKLPTPIMVMGLMKAGTTSVYGYFKCGLDPAHSELSHYDCKPDSHIDPEHIGMACGKRIRRNLTKNKKPAFSTMDQFDLYAELDAQELQGGMTLPQWEFLAEIHDQFPNATWILNLRDPSKWLDSVNRWKDLRQRFIDNPFLPDLPRGEGAEDNDMLDFYDAQAQRVRDFVATHPSHTLVEVQIDSPDAGHVMENAFGIPSACWGNRNMNNGSAIWAGV
jgi:hypothetical protein